MKFEWQLRHRHERCFSDVTIYPADIRIEYSLLLRGKSRELCVQLGVGVSGRAGETIGGDLARSKDLGKFAAGRTAVQVQLPKTFLRDDVPVGFEQAAVCFSENMRRPEIIAVDTDSLAVHIKSGEARRLRLCCKR